MATTPTTKLHLLLSDWEQHGAIPMPSVFAPPTLSQPPADFPASLMKNNLFASQVTDVLESKLMELPPALRKQFFLGEIGYIGCVVGNVTYLCKKDCPSLEPFEIRVESDVLFLKTVDFDWSPAQSAKQNGSRQFLAIVTEHQMHCYEIRSIEEEEVNFVPAFSAESPMECPLTALLSTSDGRVFGGNAKGHAFELRAEFKGRQPLWNALGGREDEGESLGIAALAADDDKSLVYCLHDDSCIDVFMHRRGDIARPVAQFRPETGSHVSVTQIFPIPSQDSGQAYLLGISSDGLLFNFEVDFRLPKETRSFVRKLLRTSSQPSVVSFRLARESSCITAHLNSEEAGTQRKLLTAALFDGLVFAVGDTEDGNDVVDLYSASRLPLHDDDVPDEAASVAFMKEPVRLNAFDSMQLALDDDNARLFSGLQLGKDELERQVFLKGRKFVVLTGTGVVDLRRRCPVEILMEILQVHDPKRLDEFFLLYGPIETATMAVQLAAARGDDHARRLLLDHHRLSAMYFSTEIHSPGELSIATRAILSYFRRLIAPLWWRSLFKTESARRKDSVKMESVLSGDLLEWFAGTLEELGRFIEGYVQEFDAVRFLDGSVFAPKRPNILSEFELLFQLIDVIAQCREILNLVRIYTEYRPDIVAEHLVKQFEKKSLQDLVINKQQSSTSLVRALIDSILRGRDPEVQEAIIFKMGSELPTLSEAKDRTYNKALSLLKRAKASPRPERQENLVLKAMNILGDECEERHIEGVVGALTELQRHYDVLHFVSITAKRLVPEVSTTDSEVQEKAQMLRRRCYNRVFLYVEDYIRKIETDDEDSADIPALFGAVQYLDDKDMMEMMMDKILMLNKVPRRSIHLPHFKEFGVAFKTYLSQKVLNLSNLHDLIEHDGVVLSDSLQRQVRVLVEVCQLMGDLKQAGDWLVILAKREPETSSDKIPLIERIADLNDARAMYETAMPENFLREIEKEIEVAMFQQRVLTIGKQTFAIMSDASENAREVRQLLLRLVDANTLYKIIQEYFPEKVAQDLSIELQRITGDLGGTVSGSDTMVET